MGTLFEPEYGDRPVRIYPVREEELTELRRWAWLSLLIVGIPFLIVSVIQTVNRITRETKFETTDQ